jgi:hypothetical protein
MVFAVAIPAFTTTAATAAVLCANPHMVTMV